ncbi:MAG: McrB family protein [Flavobacteriales bacterium]
MVEEFKKWLEKFASNSIDHYYNDLNILNQYCLLNGIKELNGWSLDTFEIYSNQLKKTKEFIKFKKTGNGRGTAPLSNFKKFLITREKLSILDKNDIKWKWASGTPTNGYNSPFILCEVVKLFDNFERGKELNYHLRKLESVILGRDKFNAEKRASLVLSQERDVLSQFGQYWKLFSLTKEERNIVELTAFGKQIAIGEKTIDDFIEYQIDNILQKTINHQISSLKFILKLIEYIGKIDPKQSYLKPEELINILPLIYLDIYSTRNLAYAVIFNRKNKSINNFYEELTSNEIRFVEQHFLFLLYSEKILLNSDKSYSLNIKSNPLSDNIHEKKSQLNTNKHKIMKKPYNKILYGPPGTGKTYELTHEYFVRYTDRNSKKSRAELLDDLLVEKKYTWFDIIVAIIKENGKSSINDILNHELIQSKIRVQNALTPRQTIWGQLLSHGQLNCENIKVNPDGRREPMIIWKDANSKFDFNNMQVDELIVESIDLLENSKNLSNNTTPVKRYEFITFHQAFSYEDFIEGIKPVMDEENNELNYQIKNGIFKQICNRAKNDPENKYALFIDEINRGNIANIFGELITLIEPDKREGMNNELSVKLPYSKTIFSVPNNLDIIGTMNTADRSVEALDTALRRRFEFEEMLPNSFLLSRIKCEGIDLELLLNTINVRIEKLLDKDHQIGHSYFMNSDNVLSLSNLKTIFKNKIMPLLQEYFHGDIGKIGLVLGSGFIKENKEKTIFSKFTYDDYDLIDERKVYQLSDIMSLDIKDFKSIYEISE